MPDIIVIGGGPAGLMAAETAAQGGARVHLFDRMPTLARKFLMAGRSGLNLTHSEPFDTFLTRYGASATRLRPALEQFPPDALRAWCEDLGQPTFVGTSGRVFPRVMKASPLLRAWLGRLADLDVTMVLRHEWRGWDGEALLFAAPRGVVRVQARATIIALGGASWPRLGSDGGWREALLARGVALAPFAPSNCGFEIAWSDKLREQFHGAPLKNIALTFGDRRVRGEAVITRTGLEGGAIYVMSGLLREACARDGHANLHIDLCPDLDPADVAQRLDAPRGKMSLTSYLRKRLNLTPQAIALVHEARLHDEAASSGLALLVKGLPVRLLRPMPIARAISSAGGVMWDDIADDYALKRISGCFVAGEMIDWEAPTGGYLLQACLATGKAAAHGALEYLKRA